jgi:5'-nucleotidase
VDTERCGTNNLPDESTVSGSGCFVTVSVMRATTLGDVSAAEQKAVFDKLQSLLTCL